MTSVAQLTVESVGPGVVGADDVAALGTCPAREQFVTAVSAGVGKGAELAVVAAHQQYGVGARSDRPLRSDPCKVVCVAYADPAGEDVGLLPLEYRLVDVCRAGQHARPAEGSERRGEIVGGNRCRAMLFEHTVSLVGRAALVYRSSLASRHKIP
jgi:hypothetical protein